MSMWSEVSQEVSAALPQPNSDLFYGFRKRKIDAIASYLDEAFHQTVAFFNNKLKYIGYRTLSPEERIEYLFENNLRKGYVSIRNTETSLVFFEFDFQGSIVPISIEIPFLLNECVVYNDTRYYPLFPIVEKGGVNVTDDGKIIVKVRPKDNWLAVEVRNTGETIPDKDKDRIFDKFYQTDPSHATAGNGLGLSICKRIVELHHGTISVTSTFGLTVFTVNLPQIL